MFPLLQDTAELVADSVPVEMYQALEQAVSRLQTAVKERDNMVAERDDALMARWLLLL